MSKNMNESKTPLTDELTQTAGFFSAGDEVVPANHARALEMALKKDRLIIGAVNCDPPSIAISTNEKFRIDEVEHLNRLLDQMENLHRETEQLQKQLQIVTNDRNGLMVMNEKLRGEILELKDLLRAACCIAERKGEGTHWDRFVKSVNAIGLNGITARTYKILEGEQNEI